MGSDVSSFRVYSTRTRIETVIRQAVTTDKASGIVNDANLWATETMGNAAYPLELLMRIITVSLETNRIVGGCLRWRLGEGSFQFSVFSFVGWVETLKMSVEPRYR